MIDFWGGLLAGLLGLLKSALPWIIAGLAVLGFGVARKRAGKREARMETALEAAERYAKTRKAMDHEDAAMGDDPAVLRDRLRQRDAGRP
jgi:hypothetical protein